jgi:hypothetical protein
MNGAIPPLPQYAFMGWCLVKAQGQLYFFPLRIRAVDITSRKTLIIFMHKFLCLQFAITFATIPIGFTQRGGCSDLLLT